MDEQCVVLIYRALHRVTVELRGMWMCCVVGEVDCDALGGVRLLRKGPA